MSLLEQASLVITPNAYKESKLYSVVPNTTLGDMDVVRATTATRVNSAGLIEVVPRNLFQYSEQIDNGAWGKQNCTITPNYANNPFGTQNASLIQDSVGTSTQYRIYQSTGSNNNIFTLSLYVKRLSGTKNAYIDLGPYTAYFNFTDELIVSSSGIASFTKLDDGWYKINLTSPTNYNISATFLGFANVYNETYTSTGGNQMLFYAPQVEQGSTATEYFPTTDRLNIPRIDYSNGSCPSILVEPQRTNLLTYSNDFSNGVYNYAGINVSQPILYLNNAISPDGTLNASKLSLPSVLNNGDVSVIYRSPILLSGQNNTSIYLKGEVGNEIIYLYYLVDGVYFNKECVLTTQWKRFDLSFLGGINCYYNLGVDLRNGSEQTAKNAQNIYIYGAQLEQGSYSTSYIPTVASSVTRNADLISKTGISSLIGTEFTLFFDGFESIGGNSSRYIILKGSGGTYANYIAIEGLSNNRIAAFVYNSSSSFVFGAPTASLTNGERVKLALRCKNNDFSFYVNGALIESQASGTVPTTADLYLGYYTDYADNYNEINSAVIFNSALSNAELAQLTTI